MSVSQNGKKCQFLKVVKMLRINAINNSMSYSRIFKDNCIFWVIHFKKNLVKITEILSDTSPASFLLFLIFFTNISKIQLLFLLFSHSFHQPFTINKCLFQMWRVISLITHFISCKHFVWDSAYKLHSMSMTQCVWHKTYYHCTVLISLAHT